MEGAEKVKDIENKIKNSKQLKEKELKAANAELEKCKKVAADTRSKWNLKKQVGRQKFYKKNSKYKVTQCPRPCEGFFPM